MPFHLCPGSQPPHTIIYNFIYYNPPFNLILETSPENRIRADVRTLPQPNSFPK